MRVNELAFYFGLGLSVLALCLLTACGGGGSSSLGLSATNIMESFSGTAATGAAIANAALSFKCSNGAGAIKTQAVTAAVNGTYTYTFVKGTVQAPCFVEVSVKDADGTVIDYLHGIVQSVGAGGAAVINVTPLTESVIATALRQEDLAAYFAALTYAQLMTLKDLDLNTAWTALKPKLTTAGISHSAITDPFKDVFTADGRGHDLVLDNLKNKGLTTEHLYRMARGLTVPPTAATSVLNDTGIDWCSTRSTTTWVNNEVCTAVNWVGNLWGQQQDAYFGRDADAKAGTLTKIGSGMAGFDFSRIGRNGKPLKIQNQIYSDSGTEAAGTKWDCVRDNVTGLMWEVKRNELVSGVKHLRHKDHTYGWYNPDSASNGGAVGYPDNAATGASCTGVADTTKCYTASYVTAVNVAGICGFKDWRMPNVDELRNLTHGGRERYSTSIDINHFPNTQADLTWSSSPYAGSSDSAWSASFSDGDDTYNVKSDKQYVRLVRSSQ